MTHSFMTLLTNGGFIACAIFVSFPTLYSTPKSEFVCKSYHGFMTHSFKTLLANGGFIARAIFCELSNGV